MEAIHVFSVEDSSSRYVLRLVVMTRLVLRPERIGLTSTFTRRSVPLPLDVSPTIQRTVSPAATVISRSEEHTSELQSLMRISYAVFCLKKKKTYRKHEKQIN